MSLTISEALHQAEEAVNGGDYQSATAICNQLVQQFPGYAAAYRLLGEAYREQGYAEDAEAAFSAALLRHPRHPRAYLNLGLIAEDQGSVDAALAFCQVAWELAPDQAAMRQFLTRVAMRRFGADGELQLTHAALAQLHSSASRLRRAAAAYRAALAELPERTDLRIGLAETLWCMGQDDEAAEHCRAVLEQSPEAVQPLVILADIEKRQGAVRQADDLLRRARVSDPDGSITSSLAAKNPRADRQYLELPASAMPTLGVEVISAPVERPKIAPAPDFVYQPPRAETPVQDAGVGLPKDRPSVTSPILSSNGLAENAQFDIPDLPDEIFPFSPEEFGATADDVEAASQFLADLDLEEIAGQPSNAPRLEAIEQFQPPADVVPGLRPVSTEPPANPPAAGTGDVDLDDLTSLADSLRSEVADALARAGEPVADDGLTASRPSDSISRGYSTTLQGLADEGLTPFDPNAGNGADGATLDVAGSSGQSSGADGTAAIARDWDTIDVEIEQAVPSAIPHGYTDQLRALDEIGLIPFEVEEPDAEIDGVAPFNPFDFDGSASVGGATPVVDGPGEAAAISFEEEVSVDLQPFAVDEFDTAAPGNGHAQPTSIFGGGSGASVIPSDDDLAALLEADDSQDDDRMAIDPGFGLDATMPLTREPDMVPDEAPADLAHANHPESLATEVLPAAEELGSAFEPSPAHSAPDLSEADLDDFFMSGAATRKLSDDEVPVATAQEPADADLVDMELRPGTEMFTRARAIKLGLVSDGVISGDRELTDDSVDEAAHPDDAGETIVDVGHGPLTAVDDVAAANITRDTDTLRAALELTPDDDELRWWLAEALRLRGDVDEAYGEYRWLIRHAPRRHDAVLESLSWCVDNDPSPEMAHRLLGDLYRRRGDIARASSHAALALQLRRRSGR